MNALLESARAAGALRGVDVQLARYLLEHATAPAGSEVALAVALLAHANADGDVCIDLAALAGRNVLVPERGDSAFAGVMAPALADWKHALLASGLVASPGDDVVLPLVLAGNLLYLHRYWSRERAVADALQARLADGAAIDGAANDSAATDGAAVDGPAPDSTVLRATLARYFPERPADDRQQLAAALAMLRRFTVISGGPGTGKTTTVARILAVLLEMNAGSARPLLIRLAAPTGKAAARLTQSIRQAKAALRALPATAVVDAIPEEAGTLHRLLGARGGNGVRKFTHDADNRLALDVLVVDEASMVDLDLMASLLAALPPQARLILLGDRDQLASVEAGNVLGDICNRGDAVAWRPELCARLHALGLEPGAAGDAASPLMADSLVVLTRSHRFSSEGGIGRVAAAVNAGQFDEALFTEDGVRWRAPVAAQLAAFVDEAVATYWLDWRLTADPVEAGRRFDAFRFLCAVREGDFGVGQLNRLVEQSLQRRGLIDARAQHYAGRPLLVTRNDYGVGLFNGDVGLVLPDADAGGLLRAFFVQPDGKVRRIALNRLPAHETAYAMTVHKSQGSEFGRVTLVLPDTDSPVLTRELVYTGITRARTGAEVWAPRAILERAIQQRVSRVSGLRDALWAG